MIVFWQYVYDAACGGAARGLLIWWDEGSLAGHLIQTVTWNDLGLENNVAVDHTEKSDWPTFASPNEVEGWIAEREGWTLGPRNVMEGASA